MKIDTKAIIQRDKAVKSLFPDKTFYDELEDDGNRTCYYSWDKTTTIIFYWNMDRRVICIDGGNICFKGKDFEEVKRKYLLYKNHGILVEY